MHIAVVDDDPIQRRLLESWLEEEAHDCASYNDGNEFLTSGSVDDYDLFILDWELPDTSGLELLAEVRRRYGLNKAVIFISQRQRESDIVEALNTGADDYMVKPAKKSELMARINAVERRINGKAYSRSLSVEEYAPYTFDHGRYQLLLHNMPIDLTRKEYELAHLLFSNANKVLSRNDIYETVWKSSANVSTRTIDTHISRLRKKLELKPENGWNLNAIYQQGYRMEQVKALATPERSPCLPLAGTGPQPTPPRALGSASARGSLRDALHQSGHSGGH